MSTPSSLSPRPPAAGRLSRTVFIGAVLLGLLAHMSGFMPLTALNLVDTYLYDEKLRLAPPAVVPPEVVVVDIDDVSLAAEGRWPWPRHRLASLIEALFGRYGVAAVGLDLVLAESDDSSGMRTLRQLADGELKDNTSFAAALRRLAPRLDYDGRLAEAIAGRPVVLGYYLDNPTGPVLASHGALPPAAFGAREVPDEVPLPAWQHFGGNLASLQAVAAGGYMNFIADFDGNARRAPLLSIYQDGVYEALSLALLRIALGDGVTLPEYASAGGRLALEAVRVTGHGGERRLPVDAAGQALLPFYGGPRTIPHVPATDVLAGRVPAATLAGKIVLVGTSAPGLLDLRATPLDSAFPGVELHAQLLAAMLAGDLRQRPGFLLGGEMVLMLGAALLLLFGLPRLTPFGATLFAAGLLAFTVACDILAWQACWVLASGPPLLLILLAYLFHMVWGYLSEFRQRRIFADLFGLYVPPELVAEMARAPDHYSMEGRSATLSVMFADIRNFTGLTEGLEPRAVAQWMNSYLAEMTAHVRAQRGTLDKYIGDAIMAFWGAPVPDTEHARHAVLSALAMLAALPELNRRCSERGWPAIQLGIGINTGPMIVGDLGSQVRKAYTVVGDAVNLASRLEELTKYYGVPLLIGAETRRLLPDVPCLDIDRVQVKGRALPLVIYQPLAAPGRLDAAGLDRVTAWNDFRAVYEQRDWDEAERRLAAFAAATPDCPLCRLYAARLQAFRIHPPAADWDSVSRFDAK